MEIYTNRIAFMSRLKVLVVDDEPGIRSGVTRILKNFRVDYPFMDEAFEFDVFEAERLIMNSPLARFTGTKSNSASTVSLDAVFLN